MVSGVRSGFWRSFWLLAKTLVTQVVELSCAKVVQSVQSVQSTLVPFLPPTTFSLRLRCVCYNSFFSTPDPPTTKLTQQERASSKHREEVCWQISTPGTKSCVSTSPSLTNDARIHLPESSAPRFRTPPKRRLSNTYSDRSQDCACGQCSKKLEALLIF